MRSEPSRHLGIILPFGAVFALAIASEVPHFNGPYYWAWPWRTLPFDRAILLFAAPLVVYAYLLRSWTAAPALSPARARWLVAGLVACSMMFQYAGVHTDERGRHVIPDIVADRWITSYYTDARQIKDLRRWLPDFANAELSLHSETHPPGPILYWYACIKLFGKHDAKPIGAFLIGAIGSLGVAMIYLLASLWTSDRSARLGPSFLYALLPAVVVFFPELDLVYPIGAMAMLVFWHHAPGDPRAAIGLGLTLFVASLMAYNFVVLGASMVLYAALQLHRANWERSSLQRYAVASAIAIAIVLGSHVLLWAATDYHAIDSLLASLAIQERFAAELARPWKLCIFWDLYDFFLASGMITLPLIALSLRRADPEAGHAPIDRGVTLVMLLSILIVDLTGLLRCETARVWLFLQPLALVPAGLQLTRYGLADRGLILGMLAVITVVLRCKLAFINF